MHQQVDYIDNLIALLKEQSPIFLITAAISGIFLTYAIRKILGCFFTLLCYVVICLFLLFLFNRERVSEMFPINANQYNFQEEASKIQQKINEAIDQLKK